MDTNFVSRAGEKLDFAIDHFLIDVRGLVVADFGSSTGGFVDCLLKRGAKKVYSVDTSYGELAWKLRNDKRVIVLERTNAMHINLSEKVDLVTVDTSWTRQLLVLPNAANNLKVGGKIITLVKPHYEAPREYLIKGKLQDTYLDMVLDKVRNDVENCGLSIIDITESPILGEKGKNREFLMLLESNK